MDDALPAVKNRDYQIKDLNGLSLLRWCQAWLFIGINNQRLTVTLGYYRTISSLNRPASIAARAFCCEQVRKHPATDG